VEALEEGLARRLILVCATAGSGKTALLADWVRGGDRPVAWLSLDAADNDPARFWRHVIAALDRGCPGIGERSGLPLGSPGPFVGELGAGAAERRLVWCSHRLGRQSGDAGAGGAGESAEALKLLERLSRAAAAQDRTGSRIEIGALQGLALAASGEENAAVDALAQALILA
jgi:MalT-like TPR region